MSGVEGDCCNERATMAGNADAAPKPASGSDLEANDSDGGPSEESERDKEEESSRRDPPGMEVDQSESPDHPDEDEGGKSSNDDESSSDGDSDSDSDSDDEDDDESGMKTARTTTEDGRELSEYERLRLERIKRNKEYLAQLGLEGKDGQGVLGKKPTKKRNKPAVVVRVEKRSTLSRRTKKDVNYAELTHSVAELMNKNGLKEKKKKEKKERPKRGEKKPTKERMPKFIYKELNAIKAHRKMTLKQAERDAKAAANHFKYWRKKAEAANKILKRNQEADRVAREAREERKKYGGVTFRELYDDTVAKVPAVITAIGKYNAECLVVDAAKQRVLKRAEAEARIKLLDSLQRFPHAMKNALLTLNQVLIERAPKDPPPLRRSKRSIPDDETLDSKKPQKKPKLDSESSPSALTKGGHWQGLPGNPTILPQEETPEDKDHSGSKRTMRARNVGGWIAPKWARQVKRDWLERDQPVHPFNLRKFVPQVGDTVLYFPSGHRECLKAYPDILAKKSRSKRGPLWEKAWLEKKYPRKNAKSDATSSSPPAKWWNEEWLTRVETDLGNYPLICRVDRAHAEFPPDPSDKALKNKKSVEGNLKGSKTRETSSATGAKQLRLAVTLKPLTPLLPPTGDTPLATPPIFTVLVFPCSLPPFVVPFAWAYSRTHALDKDQSVSAESILGGCRIVKFDGLSGSSDSFRLDDKTDQITRALSDFSGRSGTLRLGGAIADSPGGLPLQDVGAVLDTFATFLDAHPPADRQFDLQRGESVDLMDLIRRTLPLWDNVTIVKDSNTRKELTVPSWNLIPKSGKKSKVLPAMDPDALADSSRSLDGHLCDKIECVIEEFLVNESSCEEYFNPPVTEDVAPSYSCAVPVGMSFTKILSRLKTKPGSQRSCYYRSVESVLSDIALILENSLLYNNAESDVVESASTIVPRLKPEITKVAQAHYRELNEARKADDERRRLVMAHCSLENAASDTTAENSRQPVGVMNSIITPYTDQVSRDWLQRATSYDHGVTTWVPQAGDSVHYSRRLHAQFVKGHYRSLDPEQCRIIRALELGGVKGDRVATATTEGSATSHEPGVKPVEGSTDEIRDAVPPFPMTYGAKPNSCEGDQTRSQHANINRDGADGINTLQMDCMKDGHHAVENGCASASPGSSQGLNENCVHACSEQVSESEVVKPSEAERAGLPASCERQASKELAMDDQRTDPETNNGKAIEGIADDKVQASKETNSDWTPGTIIWVRAVFPKAFSEKSDDKVTFPSSVPLLAVGLELKSHQSHVSEVYWRPCIFPSDNLASRDEECPACGISLSSSFLRPEWTMSLPNALPSEQLQVHAPASLSSSDAELIDRCFSLLKRRCLAKVPPGYVDHKLTKANLKRGYLPVATIIDEASLPSYEEVFDDRLETLSLIAEDGPDRNSGPLSLLVEVGFLPAWLSSDPEKCKALLARYQTISPWPNLCLELVHTRLKKGYYRQRAALLNDIVEGFSTSVFLFLSEAAGRKKKPISTRRLFRSLSSNKGAKALDSPKDGTLKNDVAVEETDLAIGVRKIRELYATALVSVSDTAHTERMLGLVARPQLVPHHPEGAPPDPRTNPTRSEARHKLSRLLSALSKDRYGNSDYFQAKDPRNPLFPLGKVRIVCRTDPKPQEKFPPELIAHFGSKLLKVMIRCDGRSVRHPGAFGLIDGKLTKVTILCDGEEIPNDKSSDTGGSDEDGTAVEPSHSPDETLAPLITFGLHEYEENASLVRILFGRQDRKNACTQCILRYKQPSMFNCRLKLGHSNVDFDWELFVKTGGVHPLLQQLNPVDGEDGRDTVTAGEKIGSPSEEEHTDDSDKENNSSDCEVDKAAYDIHCFRKAEKALALSKDVLENARFVASAPLRVSKDFVSEMFPVDLDDGHYMYCVICGLGGNLLCCDGCSNVVHNGCVSLTDIPEGDWFCEECISKRARQEQSESGDVEVAGGEQSCKLPFGRVEFNYDMSDKLTSLLEALKDSRAEPDRGRVGWKPSPEDLEVAQEITREPTIIGEKRVEPQPGISRSDAKHQNQVSTLDNGAAEQPNIPQLSRKRRRGRPPKNPASSKVTSNGGGLDNEGILFDRVPEDSDFEVYEYEVLSVESEVSVPRSKRSRRPPKRLGQEKAAETSEAELERRRRLMLKPLLLSRERVGYLGDEDGDIHSLTSQCSVPRASCEPIQQPSGSGIRESRGDEEKPNQLVWDRAAAKEEQEQTKQQQRKGDDPLESILDATVIEEDAVTEKGEAVEILSSGRVACRGISDHTNERPAKGIADHPVSSCNDEGQVEDVVDYPVIKSSNDEDPVEGIADHPVMNSNDERKVEDIVDHPVISSSNDGGPVEGIADHPVMNIKSRNDEGPVEGIADHVGNSSSDERRVEGIAKNSSNEECLVGGIADDINSSNERPVEGIADQPAIKSRYDEGPVEGIADHPVMNSNDERKVEGIVDHPVISSSNNGGPVEGIADHPVMNITSRNDEGPVEGIADHVGNSSSDERRLEGIAKNSSNEECLVGGIADDINSSDERPVEGIADQPVINNRYDEDPVEGIADYPVIDSSNAARPVGGIADHPIISSSNDERPVEGRRDSCHTTMVAENLESAPANPIVMAADAKQDEPQERVTRADHADPPEKAQQERENAVEHEKPPDLPAEVKPGEQAGLVEQTEPTAESLEPAEGTGGEAEPDPPGLPAASKSDHRPEQGGTILGEG